MKPDSFGRLELESETCGQVAPDFTVWEPVFRDAPPWLREYAMAVGRLRHLPGALERFNEAVESGLTCCVCGKSPIVDKSVEWRPHDWYLILVAVYDLVFNDSPIVAATHLRAVFAGIKQHIIDAVKAGDQSVEPALQTALERVRDDLAARGVIGQSSDQAADLQQPKTILSSWREITTALGLPHEVGMGKVKSLNERLNGPIPKARKGSQPVVERGALIDSWNKLAVMQQELANQRDGKAAAASASYSHGRDGTMSPEIGGHQRKRRSKGKER